MRAAMKRFVVCRPMPSISHPETAYCQRNKRSKSVRAFKLVTYTVFRPEQLDQQLKAVVVRHRCWPDLHHHRVGPLDPILKLDR